MNKLGVYVHVPFCNGKCAYCDFVSGVYPEEIKKKYFDALLREIKNFDFDGYETDTLYFGGGTPSSVNPEYIRSVIDELRNRSVFSDDAEITVECNPESFDSDKAKIYADCGVNRLSFGLQSATDSLLKKIGRLHDTATFVSALDIAEKYFDNISADLMLSLPGESVSDVIRAVNLLAGRQLKHISAYALKVEEGTPLAASGYVVDEDYSAELYEIASELLRGYGYGRYEVSNFALPGFESRHNLKYWNRSEYVGFGLAAHSFLRDYRSYNTSDMNEYLRGNRKDGCEFIAPKSKDAADETIMLSLRTSTGLDLKEYEKKFGADFAYMKRDEIERLSDYVEVVDGRLKLKDKGFYVMNEIIVRFID